MYWGKALPEQAVREAGHGQVLHRREAVWRENLREEREEVPCTYESSISEQNSNEGSVSEKNSNEGSLSEQNSNEGSLSNDESANEGSLSNDESANEGADESANEATDKSSGVALGPVDIWLRSSRRVEMPAGSAACVDWPLQDFVNV